MHPRQVNNSAHELQAQGDCATRVPAKLCSPPRPQNLKTKNSHFVRNSTKGSYNSNTAPSLTVLDSQLNIKNEGKI